MAAAYAALVSLMNTMDHLQNHPRLLTFFDKKQIESLNGKVDVLLDFIEKYSPGGSKESEDLERRIASAARKAEDVIKSHITDRMKEIYSMLDLQTDIGDIKKKVTGVREKIQTKYEKSHLQKAMKDMDAIKKKIMEVEDVIGESTISISTMSTPDLQEVIENMDSIKEKVMEAKEERALKDQQSKSLMRAASSRPITTGKTTMVGFDDYLIQLLDWLTRQQSDRQIISITGTGGIGKTTLARNIYKNLFIVQHFDVLVWVTISQEYNVREILQDTLSCLRGSTRGMDEMNEDELGEQLHKGLWGRRYLVILDDIWSIEAWDKIQLFFPDNRNRSRIVLTTRISSLANHLGSLGLELNLLKGDQSWNLFCQEVFGQDNCPPELEKIGKEIVEKCKGLPLSISVIGGLLRNSSKTQQYWEEVAKGSSILNSVEDNHCLSILYLSYSHLPACLKPCFLYLGIFPEDHEILLSRLVKLWIAEGLLKPNKEQSLEEVAKGYIKDLVERNLISLCRQALRLGGKFKTCKIHDLLRDLCISVAEREKLFCVRRVLHTPGDINMELCILIDVLGIIYGELRHQPCQILRSTSLGCSLVLTEQAYLIDSLEFASRFPIHLRFLACEPIGFCQNYELPSSICLLWNVQTLIIKEQFCCVTAPPEIWEMLQLRYLDLGFIILPDPPPSSDKQGDFILRNLRTVRHVSNFTWSEEVCKRMPNIKRLEVKYKDNATRTNYCLNNTGHLTKLESLEYYFYEVPNRDDLMQNLMLWRSLKKLTLLDCGLHWEDLRMIGTLPYLEELKLFCASEEPEWHPVKGNSFA